MDGGNNLNLTPQKNKSSLKLLYKSPRIKSGLKRHTPKFDIIKARTKRHMKFEKNRFLHPDCENLETEMKKRLMPEFDNNELKLKVGIESYGAGLEMSQDCPDNIGIEHTESPQLSVSLVRDNNNNNNIYYSPNVLFVLHIKTLE